MSFTDSGFIEQEHCWLDTVQSGLSGCTAELYMPWVSEVLQEIGKKMGDRPYQKCFSKLHLIISNCVHVLPDDW